MSYDLMVFETSKAPTTKAEFMKWYEKLVEWGEDQDYDDASICSSRLQDWYREMITAFPAMNGPDAFSDEELEDVDEDLVSRLTDYTIAADAIYVCFSWSQAEKAYAAMRTLAQKHSLGFFDVSGGDGWGGGDILLPDGGKMD